MKQDLPGGTVARNPPANSGDRGAPLTEQWIYTLWNIIQPGKGRNSAICRNMDEPGEHYAKCNKPVTET